MTRVKNGDILLFRVGLVHPNVLASNEGLRRRCVVRSQRDHKLLFHSRQVKFC